MELDARSGVSYLELGPASHSCGKKLKTGPQFIRGWVRMPEDYSELVRLLEGGGLMD